MKKNYRHLIISTVVCLVLVVSCGAIAATIGLFSDRDTPPKFSTDEQTRTESKADTASSNKKNLLSEYEINFLLGYLDNFKEESLSGNENTEEAIRINKKNQLINDYKEYVDSIRYTAMTEEEYDAHHDRLMAIFLELLPLEPEKTAVEKFEIAANRILVTLEDVLAFCKYHGESYISSNNVNPDMLPKAIEELNALKEIIASGSTALEEIEECYRSCLETAKLAAPEKYRLMLDRNYISENIENMEL